MGCREGLTEPLGFSGRCSFLALCSEMDTCILPDLPLQDLRSSCSNSVPARLRKGAGHHKAVHSGAFFTSPPGTVEWPQLVMAGGGTWGWGAQVGPQAMSGTSPTASMPGCGALVHLPLCLSCEDSSSLPEQEISCKMT